MIVLYVLTGSEIDIRDRLLGYSPIVPMEVSLIRVKKIYKKVPKVLMQGYVFIDCDVDETKYYSLRNTTGVIKVLNFKEPIPKVERDYIVSMGQGMIKPHIIDSCGNVINGFFKDYPLIKVCKRQRRAVFEIFLLGKKHRVSVSAVFTT